MQLVTLFAVLSTLTAVPEADFGGMLDKTLYILAGLVSLLVTLREFILRLKGRKILDTTIESVETALTLAIRCSVCAQALEPCIECRAVAKRIKLAAGAVARSKGLYDEVRKEVKRVTEPGKGNEAGRFDVTMARGVVGLAFWCVVALSLIILVSIAISGSGCRGPAREYIEADALRRESVGEPYLYHLRHCSDPTYVALRDGGRSIIVTKTAKIIEAGEADVAAWDRQLEQARKGK